MCYFNGMTYLVALLTLLVAPWTAYLYSSEYAYAPGVHLHGLTSIIGFGYSAYLSIITGKGFLKNGVFYDLLGAFLTVFLLISIYIKSMPVVTVAVVLQLLLMAMIAKDFKWTKRDGSEFFAFSSIPVAFSAWVYFLYSMHADTFLIFKTSFSYSLLALSFPFSLAAFSQFYHMLPNIKKWRPLLAVLVTSVLMMFFGILLKTPMLEGFFALVLMVWIVYLIRAAWIKKQNPLVAAFIGLLVTGSLGVVYFSQYGKPDSAAFLAWHAHAAYMLWAIIACYIIYFGLRKIDRLSIALFFAPLLVSFVFLGTYLINKGPLVLIYASSAIFTVVPLGALFRIIYSRKTGKNVQR